MPYQAGPNPDAATTRSQQSGDPAPEAAQDTNQQIINIEICVTNPSRLQLLPPKDRETFSESMVARTSKAAWPHSSHPNQRAGFRAGREMQHSDTAAPASTAVAFGVTS
jgi:allophanate hydrolase subunit 2